MSEIDQSSGMLTNQLEKLIKTDHECYGFTLELMTKIEEWLIQHGKTIPRASFGLSSHGGITVQGKETNGRELVISIMPENSVDCAWFDNEDVDEEKSVSSFDDIIMPLKWLVEFQ